MNLKGRSEQGYKAAMEEIIKINEEFEREDGTISNPDMAWLALQIKDYNKAVKYYIRGYKLHLPGLPYLSVVALSHPELESIPEYIELLKKMKLPLPD